MNPAAQPDNRPRGRRLNENIRILVVDENIGSAKLLATLLGYMGPYVVDVAHDGPAVLEKITSFRPDAVLLDIGLPGMDGYEVGREIRQNPENDDLLLVALTGHSMPEYRQRSMDTGFDVHLVKPPSVQMLQDVLSHPKLTG